MKIHSLHLKNYRCFREIDIDFDDRLTVLVGVNGSGKTSILDALSLFLKYVGHPKNIGDSLIEYSIEDVSIGCEPNDVEYCVSFRPEYQTDAIPEIETADLYFASINQYGNASAKIKNPPKKMMELENPLCVAYMAGRSILIQNNLSSPSIHAAHDKSFERTIDYAATLVWFNNADADEARDMRDNGQKNELPELKALREALLLALLGHYERPRMLGNPPELILYEKGTDRSHKLSHLSDGYRSMLALVMDLARRMAQKSKNTNPATNPLRTKAIVLIDEVELHLHPSWQQSVLTTLMRIFPNTQFIVTTHSPQVLTSIPPQHIRVLSNGKAYTIGEQTEGAESSRVLKHVFGVDPRPTGVEIVKMLKEYSKLVYDDMWDSDRAKELRRMLAEHFGDDDLELMELDLHIENKKWEQSL